MGNSDEERIERFSAKAEKYGGWKVSADKIHAIFEEVIDPSRIGFSKARRGYLARRFDDDVAHVIKLQAFKGGAYGVYYGVSLSCMPYPFAPAVKWHRSLKSVALDLFERPQDHMREPANSQNDAGYMATSLIGEICFREELGSIWQRVRGKVLAWFDATRTLAHVLSRCDEHLAWKPRGPGHVPGRRLVRAFTLARMSRSTEARADLEQFLRERQGDGKVRANLFATLEKISSTSLQEK